ncbi:hypothetical protein M0Q50_02285 [bacterium]|jgi:hypothetical protein|nr:hypothetical protein [bacterium]
MNKFESFEIDNEQRFLELSEYKYLEIRFDFIYSHHTISYYNCDVELFEINKYQAYIFINKEFIYDFKKSIGSEIETFSILRNLMKKYFNCNNNYSIHRF